jgi:Histidine kinase-, DNA gyrase B-, and HSP90-like ATPase
MTVRSILSFSRDLEFATEAELAKRMGCSRGLWLRATLKELIDNALDGSEEHGVTAPEISVRVDGEALTVADNGAGFPPELVERLCNRAERTSTREAFAAPDRGSQGNALQTLMALPFGFGRQDAGLTITSQGVLCRHHAPDTEFILANAMASETLRWTRRRFKCAIARLVQERLLQCVHPGGRGPGDPPRYRLLRTG